MVVRTFWTVRSCRGSGRSSLHRHLRPGVPAGCPSPPPCVPRLNSYGQVTPTKAPPQGLTTEQKALREATFKPNLRPSKLRDRAQSSGYGKAVVGRKPASAPETPSFKPRMSNTATARRILQQAPSAGYGKEDVKLAPHKTHDGAPSQQLCSLRLPPVSCRCDGKIKGAARCCAPDGSSVWGYSCPWRCLHCHRPAPGILVHVNCRPPARLSTRLPVVVSFAGLTHAGPTAATDAVVGVR